MAPPRPCPLRDPSDDQPVPRLETALGGKRRARLLLERIFNRKLLQRPATCCVGEHQCLKVRASGRLTEECKHLPTIVAQPVPFAVHQCPAGLQLTQPPLLLCSSVLP